MLKSVRKKSQKDLTKIAVQNSPIGDRHMVREGEPSRMKKTVGRVKCFGPVVINE